ncbi:MAG TPA: hypothetical protein VGO37_13185 [Steroidobacteraceae bacterium]|nr:hypothetical protein [Steroidobacteraceae bacterium]
MVPRVRFPVKCPVCGNEALGSYRIADVVDALINDRKIRLYATCHDRSWKASDVEVQQLREYLGAVWLDTRLWPSPPVDVRGLGQH